ncbi:glycosyltransferase [Patescibacteria group bacterium]|nr:glycosyltransferase [Patescibacteria group bacterium]
MVKLLENKVGPIINLKDYRQFGLQVYDEILSVAEKLQGKSIFHINATPQGGGVAELLKSQVPFEKAVGLKSYWLSMANVPPSFFTVTKKIHNLLQGKPGLLNEEEKNLYFSVNQELAASLKDFCDQFPDGLAVVHDPQPLPLIQFIPKNFNAIFRLHLDVSVANLSVMDFLKSLIEKYKLVILSNEDYFISLPWIEESKRKVIMPAIDPLSEKNQPMDIRAANAMLEKFNINPLKPLIAQVSRFDAWKNPLGTIQAYYSAKKEIPALQLVLLGLLLAIDDPEAVTVFEKIKKHARGDPDIHLFADPAEFAEISNETFVNAIYTASDLIIQNSVREGFGLTVTEAMWKNKPVIAGIAKGILMQIEDGENGILAATPEDIAKNIVKLIKDKISREKLGRVAHESVRQRFLLPRFILDNFKLYASLKSKIWS